MSAAPHQGLTSPRFLGLFFRNAPVRHGAAVLRVDVRAENRCVMQARVPRFSGIPTSLLWQRIYAVASPGRRPVRISALAPRAHVGLWAFCQHRILFSDRNRNGGNYSVAFYVARGTFVCYWPLECFLLNCCCKWSFSRQCFAGSFSGPSAKGILQA